MYATVLGSPLLISIRFSEWNSLPPTEPSRIPFSVFEPLTHYVAQAHLNPAVLTRLASNSKRSTHLCLPSARLQRCATMPNSSVCLEHSPIATNRTNTECFHPPRDPLCSRSVFPLTTLTCFSLVLFRLFLFKEICLSLFQASGCCTCMSVHHL